MDKIKILIADDHEVIHSGITGILRHEENLEIVDHAYNGQEAVEKSLIHRPDIIFMDISMPVLNGIEAAKRIKEEFAEARIIALTQYEEQEYIYQFLKNGGLGYLLKNSKQDEFLQAIQAVMDNRKYLSFELNLALSERASGKGSSEAGAVHLTRREIEIVRKIAQEKTNNQIANELNISLRTVETHRRNIAQKLKAKSVVSILKYASQHNLIDF